MQGVFRSCNSGRNVSLRSKRKKRGGKTGGKNAQRVSLRLDTNGQKCVSLSTNDLLNELERLIYSGSMEEIEGLQLSLISTSEAACRASSQAASFIWGQNWGQNAAMRSHLEGEGEKSLPP